MARKEKCIAWLIFAVMLSLPLIVQAIWGNIFISIGVDLFILIVMLILLMIPDDRQD